MSVRAPLRRVAPGVSAKPKGKAMGEVRVRVRLGNAADGTAVRGRQRAKSRSRVVDALVDTGAVRTVLPAQVARVLGLRCLGRAVAEYADGRREAVDLVGPLLVEIDQRVTVEDALVLGDEVLIGQTVLEKLDLHVDCANQRLVPNPAHPDQPVTKVK
ncbi:MAG: clan AA aspartic protease [Planctomycetota bacterium]|nr:clan AA aspartic protease [Planctomycetota bacterium]